MRCRGVLQLRANEIELDCKNTNLPGECATTAVQIAKSATDVGEVMGPEIRLWRVRAGGCHMSASTDPASFSANAFRSGPQGQRLCDIESRLRDEFIVRWSRKQYIPDLAVSEFLSVTTSTSRTSSNWELRQH